MYSIVDIETTGNGINGNKITEISIFRFDGHEIVDEFTSLVNPECEIPYFITGLTGIDNNLVRNAPLLKAIVPKIQDILKDTVFVAHNVSFDYNIIKKEFKDLGIAFSHKKLCTVRLSRKLFPGYNSYSLGKLCSALQIPLSNRHRARGDAHATVLLFKKLLRANGAAAVFKKFLNARSQEITLPSSLSKTIFDELPQKPGIYFFKNDKGKTIYIGKAINIKKRVLGHFYDKKDKELRLCKEIAHIDFELSGNELVALLMESAAIKRKYPEYNSAQKKRVKPYGIFYYEDRNGIRHLAYNLLKAAPNPFITLYSQTDCRQFLERMCKTFKLCPKYCHLQENVAHCFHYSIATCEGICKSQESVMDYNTKVKNAINSVTEKNLNYFIKGKGRNLQEDTVILVKESIYMGFGFIPKDLTIDRLRDIEAFIQKEENTLEAQRMILSHIHKNPGSAIQFETGENAPF